MNATENAKLKEDLQGVCSQQKDTAWANTILKTENKALKEKVDSILRDNKTAYDTLAETTKAHDEITLQLVAVREALIFADAGTMLIEGATEADKKNLLAMQKSCREALSTPPPTLIAQMEKKLEIAGKMAEALRDIKLWVMHQEHFKDEDKKQPCAGCFQLDIADKALALWNTANEVRDNA